MNIIIQGVSVLPNYYRLVLRCRSEARKRFAAIRSDVLVKLELLDNKHVQDIVHQVSRKEEIKNRANSVQQELSLTIDPNNVIII